MIIMSELVKLFFSTALLAVEQQSLPRAIRAILRSSQCSAHSVSVCGDVRTGCAHPVVHVCPLTEVIYREFTHHRTECLKLLVPAGLYFIQNNVLIYALTNLDAAVYQICYQSKLLVRT